MFKLHTPYGASDRTEICEETDVDASITVAVWERAPSTNILGRKQIISRGAASNVLWELMSFDDVMRYLMHVYAWASFTRVPTRYNLILENPLRIPDGDTLDRLVASLYHMEMCWDIILLEGCAMFPEGVPARSVVPEFHLVDAGLAKDITPHAYLISEQGAKRAVSLGMPMETELCRFLLTASMFKDLVVLYAPCIRMRA